MTFTEKVTGYQWSAISAIAEVLVVFLFVFLCVISQFSVERHKLSTRGFREVD